MLRPQAIGSQGEVRLFGPTPLQESQALLPGPAERTQHGRHVFRQAIRPNSQIPNSKSQTPVCQQKLGKFGFELGNWNLELGN
jgi:hypothetical protein